MKILIFLISFYLVLLSIDMVLKWYLFLSDERRKRKLRDTLEKDVDDLHGALKEMMKNVPKNMVSPQDIH